MVHRKARGLTLLELLVALAVAAVLAAVAVPSFEAIAVRNRLSLSSNQLLGAMLAARNLAITRNVRATFCAGSADDGCHRDWARGEWIVFIDRDGDGAFEQDDELHAIGSLPSPDTLVIAGNGPFNSAIVFRPSGAATWPSGAFAAGRLRTCAVSAVSPNAVELVLIGSGRAVSQTCDLNGLCPLLSDQSNRCR